MEKTALSLFFKKCHILLDKLSLIILVSFLLTSCGFHLRGQFPLSPILNNLYIQTQDPYGQLTRNLREYLKVSGVRLVNSRDEATSVLTILSETTSQQLIGISGTQHTR